MIGKQILSYKIESVLGEGGMGTVYLGVHTQLGRKVAVKMLHPNLSKNASLRERFKNEASALAHLHQPNIVTLFDYYESQEALFLVMEYVDGMELADHINKVSGPIDDKNATHYFNQILDAFSYAHKKKVVHRDIKPSNILINSENDIKIMDFGIAKIMDNQKSLTKTGTQIGTVFYMSPEQVNGQKIDHRSDIYSLGVTLFQMITGKCPYNNDTTEFQIYSHIVNDPLPDLKSFYPGASEHLGQVIAKATQKNVEDRFQSCEEFKKALNNPSFIADPKEPTETQSKKVSSKPPLKTEVKKEKAPSPTPPVPTKKKKNTSIIIIAAIALAIAGYYINENNKENSTKNEEDICDCIMDSYGKKDLHKCDPSASIEELEGIILECIEEQDYYEEMEFAEAEAEAEIYEEAATLDISGGEFCGEDAEEAVCGGDMEEEYYESVLTHSNVEQVFYEFIYAWNDQNAEKQINYLSYDFVYQDQNKTQYYDEFVSDKRRINKKYDWIDVNVENVKIAIYTDYATVSFYQHYNSPKYESWGSCTYYFKEVYGEIKLYKEIFNKESSNSK